MQSELPRFPCAKRRELGSLRAARAQAKKPRTFAERESQSPEHYPSLGRRAHSPSLRQSAASTRASTATTLVSMARAGGRSGGRENTGTRHGASVAADGE